ncbi:MAG: hypothetical protein JSV81_06735 [Anaerolineales bacterium]|nr:MAG: hypothetical protein JSV81_06735 [Anaerolineales bacterium]
MRSRAVGRTHLTVLLVYLLLAILLTWPTVTHIASHLPGDGGDDPAIAWNLWWVKHALLTLRTNPLFSSAMFYPIGVNLAFYTLTVLNALTAMPVTLALGVVTASNLHTWFTMIAGGYGAFLLTRQHLANARQSVWAAALAGGFYAFTSSQLFYVSLGQFNIASSHWVPYTILFMLKSRRSLTALRWPALAALFLAMQAWAEMTYASFLLVFIGLYVAYEVASGVIWRIGQSPNQRIGGPTKLAATVLDPTSHVTLAIRNLLVLALLFALGISPLLGAMLPDMRAEGDFWVQGSGFAEVFSADLAGFLVPTMHHPLLGELVRHTGIRNFDKGQHLYPGFMLLILAAIGTMAGVKRASPPRMRSRTWFWLMAALFFAWLALGPSVHINGADSGIPGPFLALQALPFFKGNRYPSRYSVMLVLSLAVLSAMGIQAIARKAQGQPGGANGQRIRFPVLCCLLATVFAFEHLSLPLPQSDMTIPAPYTAMATQPGEFAILDIPVAWRNGFRITGPIHPGFMFGQFYQTAHTRPLLQGNTSRNPEFKFQYFTQAPVINSILALETGHQLPPERWEADRAVAGDVLRFFGIRYIVVRPGPGTDPAVTPEATIPYIEAVMPVEPVTSSPSLTLYRVNLLPPPNVVEISSTTPLARLYFGEGWGAIPDRGSESADQAMWALRQTARLFVPLNDQPQAVRLRILSPGQGQQVVVDAGGWRSSPLILNPGWEDYTLSLPAEAVQTGLNEIQLHFDRLYPTDSLPRTEGETGPRAILVQSAGQEVGDFGHIYVNGVDVSPNQRGYNLAAISPQGEIRAASFDTHLDPGASQALAGFIQSVPPGHTVAVAAADEASMNLGEDAIVALRSIGLAGDLRGKFRWSHAFIGVKGAEPGSGLEAMDGLRPVSVALGPAVTEPRVAAAVEWIRFESEE